MKAILLDNRCSFTFNLVHLLAEAGAGVTVVRNTAPAGDVLARAEGEHALIVLGPGPGGPADAGSTMDVIAGAKGRLPVLGICLGHQAIALEAGAPVVRADAVVHGKAALLDHDGAGMMEGVPNPFAAARYHSLCVRDLPPRFRVHARSGSIAMALSDEAALQWGVQFHPESLLTHAGERIIANVLRARAQVEQPAPNAASAA